MVREYDPEQIPSVYDLREAPLAKEGDDFEQVVFRGIDQMIAMTTIGPNREDKEPHKHSWEQTNMVLEGELDFIIGGDRLSLGPYDVLEIPPGVEHVSRAVSDEPARLLAMWPLREDRLDATAYQTEFDV